MEFLKRLGRSPESARGRFDECLLWNRLGLASVGIWPLDREASGRVFRRVQVMLVYFAMCSILVPQWCDLYRLSKYLDVMLDTMLCNVFIMGVILKFYNFNKWKTIFKELLENMRSTWVKVMSDTKSVEEKVIFEEFTSKARSYSLKYLLVIYASGTSYAITPFLINDLYRKRRYPFFGYYYLDQNSDYAYYFFFFTQMISGAVIGLANFATDSIFLVCIYHFCAQLRVLQNDLLKFGNQKHGDVKLRLAGLIQRHQIVLRHGRSLQTIFGGASFQQLLVSCLMICANGFKLIVSLNNGDIIDSFRYMFNVPLTLLGILFYCQPGDELIAQSQGLHESIYQSAWVDLESVTARRHLIFMILRSQRPLSVTAGKLYVLSLPNFMKILRKSLSGLSVLHAMYAKSM